jgi:hypothetical protein
MNAGDNLVWTIKIDKTTNDAERWRMENYDDEEYKIKVKELVVLVVLFMQGRKSGRMLRKRTWRMEARIACSDGTLPSRCGLSDTRITLLSNSRTAK